MMNASPLRERMTVLRQNLTADGFGGYNANTTTTIGTYWCSVTEKASQIDEKNGIRLHQTEVDIIIRKDVADLLQPEDIIQLENSQTTYRLNGYFQVVERFWVKVTATKRDNG